MIAAEDGQEGEATATVFTVTAFANRLTKHLANIGAFEIEGEVTGLKPKNGHVSFSLRDPGARVSAFVHARVLGGLPFELVEGLVVRGRVRLTYFGMAGQVQLTFETLSPRDEGPLQLALRQLTTKLRAEGLFDPSRKRPLPRFPRVVGVVTSRDGAVFADIQTTIARRWPGLTIQLFPVAVQGPSAASEVARAIAAFNRAGAADVLIVGRGGGSLEDLWAFNEEAVARAIAASTIPVIAAVGHAADHSIADDVADRSAPTPTAAAELVTPVTLGDVLQRVDAYERRAASSLRRRVDGPRRRIETLEARRVFREPDLLVRAARRETAVIAGELSDGIDRLRAARAERLDRARLRLHAANPLAILERGFAVVERDVDRRVIRDPAEVATGDRIRIRVHGGSFEGEVR